MNYHCGQSGFDRNGNSTSISANYISPEFDSTASESYKERIRKDIFNISNIPDMSDQNFSGNASGIAIRYKIFGFEQAIAQTMNAFKRSLADRCELLFKHENNLNNTKRDLPNVTIESTPNLPYAVSEELKMLTDAGVPVSRKTMYNQVHFTNAEIEEKNLEEESELELSKVVNDSFNGKVGVITPDQQKEPSNNTKDGDLDG